MDARPGTYAILFTCRDPASVVVGRLGTLDVGPGHYVYVGSAFGPGGVAARVGRHCRVAKPRRWHIDYLRPHLAPRAVWFSHDPERHEHQWADTLAAMRGVNGVPRFGCSDCRCASHLFYTQKEPRSSRLLRALCGSVHVEDL